MPTFCRHNRIAENCSICSKKARVDLSATGARPPANTEPRRERRPASSRRTPKQTDVTVRRMARAEDDGYDNELVPGLRATADAERLARCLTASARDLDDRRTRQRTLEETAAELAPTAGALDAGTLTAGAGTPEARFDRAYERLARPGMGRAERIEVLITAWAHGALPGVEPWTLRLGDAASGDPVLLAAKRIFGTGDALLLGRRLRALCDACEVPVASAEAALREWQAGQAPDVTPGDGIVAALALVRTET